jgi:amidase
MFARVIPGAALAVALAASTSHLLAQRPNGREARTVSTPAYDVVEKTIPELQEALTARAVTSRQLVAAYLARIAAYDQQGPAINAMVAINPKALEIADELDKERAAGRVRGPLHGIPILVKDNYETADMPTTGGSIALAGFNTGHDAFQVQKLRDAGAIIIGKTNLHELARGITTISSISGQTKNPYDVRRNPGGSSGGTGAAIAANFGAAGMGSDTCGSIRIPSANNNLFGLRSTMGLASRQGIIPLAHTQDVGGPLARSVVDLALILDATVGPDPGDESTRAGDGHRVASFRERLKPEALTGLRIGVVKNLFGDAPEDAEVSEIVRKALDVMRSRGAVVTEMTIPSLDATLQGSSVIGMEFKFDFMDYLAKYPSAPVHSLTEIVDRGEYSAALEPAFRQSAAIESRTSEAYQAALRKRDAVRELLLAAMTVQQVDVLAYPVLTRKPALISETVRGRNNCQASAHSGLPAMAMPAGFTADGLPVGLELLGAAWSDAQLVSIAYAYEQAARPRRLPTSTPPLVEGKGPAVARATVTLGDVRASFTFDSATGRLTYEASRKSAAGGGLLAAVHRGTAGVRGPVVLTIFNTTSNNSGDVILDRSDRDAIRSGDLYLAVPSPEGPLRAQLRMP